MQPYYQKDGITIYHGDCREILPSIDRVDLLLTDPPYGIGADKNLRANKQHGKAACPSRDYGVGDWDNSAPPVGVLQSAIDTATHAIVWGGNYFGLPASQCWLVWDKENGSNGYADCELAWTNLRKAVRRFKWRWQGMLQENMGEKKEHRVHPTQKPLAVMSWALSQVSECRTVLDPYMGSGTTLLAAKNAGMRAVGIEISERYCEIAANRLAQGVLEFA